MMYQTCVLVTHFNNGFEYPLPYRFVQYHHKPGTLRCDHMLLTLLTASGEEITAYELIPWLFRSDCTTIGLDHILTLGTSTCC